MDGQDEGGMKVLTVVGAGLGVSLLDLGLRWVGVSGGCPHFHNSCGGGGGGGVFLSVKQNISNTLYKNLNYKSVQDIKNSMDIIFVLQNNPGCTKIKTY